jgi:hypothetical protein
MNGMTDQSGLPGLSGNRRYRRTGLGRLIFGLVVLGLGVTFLLDELDLVESDRVLHYWPVILLLIAAVKLLAPAGPTDRTAGIFFAFLGLLFLGDTANWYSVDFSLVWPALLILLGLFIVKRGLFGPGRAGAVVDGAESLSLFAFWSGHERKVTSRNFSGGDVTAVMGGAEIDLRAASVSQASGPAVLDLFVLMGGVDLYLAPEWEVVLETTAIMAAVEDNRKTIIAASPSEAPAPSGHRPRLVLRGLVLMGGVELKS